MARDRANIRTDMLGDSDYRELSMAAQHLYMHLLIHPTLSYAGVADWRPGRLAKMTADGTLKAILEAADELQRGHYIYCDDETEEVLIRSFVRHDGLIKRTNMAVAMAKAYSETASPQIRRYFAHEIQRLHDDQPDLECWSDHRVKGLLKEPSEDLKTIGNGINQPLFDPSVRLSVDPSPMASGDPSVMALPNPSVHLCPTTATATSTSTPTDVGGSGGRRSPERPLPADWQPNGAHKDYAKEKSLDLNTEAERFIFHAQANDRRQRNWDAAFRMWLTKAKPTMEDSNPWNQ